jgi:hypothetical protein
MLAFGEQTLILESFQVKMNDQSVACMLVSLLLLKLNQNSAAARPQGEELRRCSSRFFRSFMSFWGSRSGSVFSGSGKAAGVKT